MILMIHMVTIDMHFFPFQDNGEALEDELSVFTYTPEAIYGVSHITLSPEHLLNRTEYYKVK